jgi:pimeloyl-ACP methyl ester carboxylesterase
MQSLHVNGTDMAYLEVGHGPPLVCVHGSLGDFRTWSAVIDRCRKSIP